MSLYFASPLDIQQTYMRNGPAQSEVSCWPWVYAGRRFRSPPCASDDTQGQGMLRRDWLHEETLRASHSQGHAKEKAQFVVNSHVITISPSPVTLIPPSRSHRHPSPASKFHIYALKRG